MAETFEDWGVVGLDRSSIVLNIKLVVYDVKRNKNTIVVFIVISNKLLKKFHGVLSHTCNIACDSEYLYMGVSWGYNLEPFFQIRAITKK